MLTYIYYKKYEVFEFFLLLILFACPVTYGQKRFELEITVSSSISNTLDKLDTLLLKNIFTKKVDTTLANIELINNKVTLAIDTGFYLITLSAKGFKFRKSDYVAVCSLCDNKVTIRSMLDNPTELLYLLCRSAYYSEGKEGLKKDFQAAFNEKDLKHLKTIENFSISMFLTKKLEISDLTITGNSLKQSDKDLITKGIHGLNKWKVGIVNGKDGDTFLSIQKSDLLE